MRLIHAAFLICLLPGLLLAEAEAEKSDISKMRPKEVRAHAKKLGEEGKLDEAIAACESLFSRYQSATYIIEEARNLEVYMRLLWKRNKPETEKGSGDRQVALETGKNFITLTKETVQDKAEGDALEIWKRVEALVLKYEMELDWEKKFAGYLGVFEKTDDPEEKGETLRLMIELLMEHKEYRRALEQCRVFLDKERDITRTKWNRGYAMYYKGLCHEELNQPDDAIVSYALAWTTHMGMIEVSAPAMERWMRVLWKRNTPGGDGVMSDRRGACEGGRQYIDLTKRFQDKMREDDHRLWKRVKDLTEAYEAQLKRREPKPAPESKGVFR